MWQGSRRCLELQMRAHSCRPMQPSARRYKRMLTGLRLTPAEAWKALAWPAKLLSAEGILVDAKHGIVLPEDIHSRQAGL